ncbi:MAG: response regulator [Planctomycetia bacterium]|nr:response regulator [Planctomycetia bacterium]MCC7313960.1 response regulator [Planctomycetota bacterium]
MAVGSFRAYITYRNAFDVFDGFLGWFGLGLFVSAVILRWASRGRDDASSSSENQVAATPESSHMALEALASWAHEIRNPLSALIGHAELLHDTTSLTAIPATSSDSAARETALTNIRTCSRHILGLINDTLDMARLVRGRIPIDITPCSPHRVMMEVRQIVSARALANNLELTVACEGPIPEAVNTDAVRLRQILLNLVSNAIKFTHTGFVRIVARVVHATPTPLLEFQVIDSGPGLTPDQLAGLFVPFQPVGGNESLKAGGVGLGLVISKKLASLLEGELLVESRPGVGTTFSIRIPAGPLDRVRMLDSRHLEEWAVDDSDDGLDSAAVDAAVATHAGQTPTAQAVEPMRVDLPSGCRILLADDAAENRKLFALLIHRAGGIVTLAENGREAVGLVCSPEEPDSLASSSRGKNFPVPFDLVILDLEMPVMCGIDAVREMRAAGRRVPVIALTAHDTPDLRRQCREAGFCDYITKPIDRNDFLTILTSWIQPARTRARSDNDGSNARRPPQAATH